MNDTPRPPVTLTRQQLYDRIWSVSAVQLAKELGVSDVAISKACKRHQIPKPPLGYWAKLAAGKAPPRPALPVLVDPSLQSVTFSPPPPRIKRPPDPGDVAAPSPDGPEFRSSELIDLLSRVSNSELSWEVPGSLRKPHPAVASTLEGLRRCSKESRYVRPGEADLLYPSSQRSDVPLLDVRVSNATVERAARLAQGILDAALAVGFELGQRRDQYRSHFYLELFHHKVQFGIRELTTREPHVPTAKELADEAKYSFSKPPKWDHQPNGMLRVNLYAHEWRHGFAEFADGKVRRVEQMAREIVMSMLAEVDRQLVRQREERERQRQAFAEADARRREEERQKAEQQRVDGLVAQVERWELAKRIRRYRRAATRAALEQGTPMEAGGPVSRWLCWLDEVADRFDPLVRPPEPDQ